MNGGHRKKLPDGEGKGRAAGVKRIDAGTYRSFFESMNDGCLLGELIRDRDGRPVDFAIHEANSACEKLTGYCRDRLAGRRISEIAPADETAWLRHIGEVIGHGEPVRFEEYSPSIRKWLNISAYSLGRGERYVVIISDATERRQAEEALRKSEAFLENVFDGIQDGISVLDRDLNIVRTNHVMEEWYRHRMPLAGKKCYQVYHGRPEPCDVCPSRGAIRQKAMQCEIVPFHDENNVVKGWQELYSFPLLGADGRVTGVIEHIRDITERKRSEEALRESEEKFRAVAETASVAICILQDGRFQYVNPAMETISGYPKEALASIDFTALVHQDALERIGAQYSKWLSGASPEGRSEFKGTRRNGEVRWADIGWKTISYRGRPAVLLTGIDITERKRAEEALRESEEKFRAVAETSPTVICVIRGRKPVYFNLAVERFSGYTIEEITRMDIRAILTPEDGDLLKRWEEAERRGDPAPSHFEFSFYHKNGDIRWVDVTLGAVSAWGYPAYIVSAIDITDRKRTERELLEAKAQAELYLDLMGHDINNIHQVALGYLEVARDAAADERQKVHLTRPIEALQRSAQLIENVQKLQQLREGTIDAQTIDLCTLLPDLVREYGAMPGSMISLALNGYSGCYVLANGLLYDVFANLAGNAIRHSGGRASVSISLDRRMEEDGMYYAVSVEDNGPGIPDDLKADVFRRRHKGITGTSGSGIGLHLVRSLVDSYRGRVWAEDRVTGDHSQGARFVVMLPVA